jgi:MOSC domain-containing protein
VTTATLAGLNVYPVKSCRGIAVARARVGARGLELGRPASPVGDRAWMIVDPDGRFITQRELPRLALVETAFSDDRLRLHAPGMAAFEVPLDHPIGATREVVVWQSAVPAHDEGDAVAAWLAAALGVASRLVRYDARHERRCNPEFAGDSGAHTAFADGFPLLIAGEASLADLNERLAANSCAALPMNRFRPNVVISGLPAYDEDHLDTIELDGVVIKLVKPCTRCVTTTTDQSTAIRGVEPLSTLAGYRHNDALDGVTFGMNGIVTAGWGRNIAVGSAAHCTYRF